MKTTQLRFLGCSETPFLWRGIINNIKQFSLDHFKFVNIKDDIPINLRLGNYVERFVFHELFHQESIKIIDTNIPILAGKRTLGEIDCLVLKNDKPVHLEIAYKFYVYDSSVGNFFLERWIGPNRHDTLLTKLSKLKEKQFQLLQTKEATLALEKLNVKVEKVEQQAYFKAQLFLPYNKKIEFPTLNKNCVVGFYIDIEQRSQFQNCKFYIPAKKDWLVIPHTHVNWLSYEVFCKESDPYLQRSFSPMCWMKSENGELNKFFLVWWKATKD